MYVGRNERAEAAISSFSVTSDFLQFIYSVPVTNIRSRCLVHAFSIKNIFLTILIMVTKQLYEEKIFVAASVAYGFGYLFLL